MLNQTTEIKILKLKSGEDIITKLVEKGDKNTYRSYELEKPYQILSGPTPDGQFGVQLIPYLFLNFVKNETLIVDEIDIVGNPMEPTEQLENVYREQTTGISLPSGGLEIPTV